MIRIDQITTELLKERLIPALSEKVGFKKKWSPEAFAETTGMERSTLDNYMRGDSLPTLTKFMRIAYVLGPSFINRFLRLVGMTGARRITVEPVTDFQLNASISRIQGLLGMFLEDGRIDHRERLELLVSLRTEMVVIDDWVVQNDKVEGEVVDGNPDDFLTLRNQMGGFDA